MLKIHPPAESEKTSTRVWQRYYPAIQYEQNLELERG